MFTARKFEVLHLGVLVCLVHVKIKSLIEIGTYDIWIWYKTIRIRTRIRIRIGSVRISQFHDFPKKKKSRIRP